MNPPVQELIKAYGEEVVRHEETHGPNQSHSYTHQESYRVGTRRELAPKAFEALDNLAELSVALIEELRWLSDSALVEDVLISAGEDIQHNIRRALETE